MTISEPHLTFDKEKGTLLLNISKENLTIPEFVSDFARNEGMEEKEEFHITILGYKAATKIPKDSKILNHIQDLAEKTSWAITPREEFYKISKSYVTKSGKEERQTIIQTVDLPEISNFIKSINETWNLSLDIPVPHITIFSKSSLKENMQAGIGIDSSNTLRNLHPQAILSRKNNSYKTIALPTRAQPDTIIAIFILRYFGENMFPGISSAKYEILERMPEKESEESLAEKGILLVDVGGGVFDHHSKTWQTTASALVADYLGVSGNKALSRLLQFAERDDFYGKGIISTDPLDRAFGLSGLIGSLNKKFVNEPYKVIEIILPLIDAYFEEENKRAYLMPKELEDKISNGEAETFYTTQRGVKIKCIFIETDNTSMAGFLRSKLGGEYDVIILRLKTRHINVLTRPVKKIDLRSLAALIRLQEAEERGIVLVDNNPAALSVSGTIKEIPEWYYDPATNSILNGGPNPKQINPTAIDPFVFKKLIDLGISERLWSPNNT